MNIALIDVDGLGTKKRVGGGTIYPNLALCKIAGWHRSQGDMVEWYTPFGQYDRVYMSKVFNFSEDYTQCITNATEVIRGGTGYDVGKVLPQEIDDHQPDFTIYPSLAQDVSYGFLSRGCPNHCKWCIVPQKEGRQHPYWSIDRVANGRKKAVLMDNNILSCGQYAMEQLQRIIELDIRVDFNQALDARLVNDDSARLLSQIKWLDNRIRFGCDTPKQIDECERAIVLINKYGYNGQFFLYTMLQGDIHECYDRLMHWWERNNAIRSQHKGNGIYPYAQPYRDTMKRNIVPQWQTDMAHWCNKHMIFEMCRFEDFAPRQGFKCSEYLR